MPRSLAALVLVVTLAACGDDATEVATAAEPVAEMRYTASGLVLESPGHGPELCSQSNDSYPPQCGGIEVVGWDWAAVEGEESAGGTTWGDYQVVGTYDGERLTPTQPPSPPTTQRDDGKDFTSPCPPPPGGWAAVDPATATDEARSAASEYANGQPDFAGSWVEQLDGSGSSYVLNLRFTGDLERHEAEVRAVWGGPLCVSRGERPLAELRAIQDELSDELDPDGASVDQIEGRVELWVTVADPAVQRDLDERYGEGTVVLTGFLQPVDEG